MLPWTRLEAMIAEADSVLLTTHVRPDGDALGSEIGMADLLAQKGKEVFILNASPTPSRYRFLDPTGERFNAISGGVMPTPPPFDLIIIVDTGTWSQLAGLADLVRASNAPKAVIDHHESQDDIGALQLVDTSAPACASLIYEAYEQFRGQITPEAARGLFVGLAMDTGWMHHSNTTPEALRVLGELAAAGAKPNEIYRELFEQNSEARLRLMGTMLERLTLHAGGKLAATWISQADIHAAAAHPMDTEDFITFPMSLAGVETALFFVEQRGGGTKVSFRTRGALNCSRLAERFGGGGHRPAAGATVERPLDETRAIVLDATIKAMSETG